MTKLVDDPFTEDGDTNLDSHTPNTAGDGWTLEEQTGARVLFISASIDEIRVTSPETSDRLLYSSQPDPSASGTTEYDVSYTVDGIATLSDDDPFGVFARFADTSNYYSAGTYGNGVFSETKIFKKVAGSVTEIASANLGTSIPAVGDVMIFKVRGSTSRQTFRDDTEAAETTADDTALTSAGKCGVFIGNAWVALDDIGSSWRIDDYYWDDLNGAPAATSLLPRYGHPMRHLMGR